MGHRTCKRFAAYFEVKQYIGLCRGCRVYLELTSLATVVSCAAFTDAQGIVDPPQARVQLLQLQMQECCHRADAPKLAGAWMP